jgi:nitroreductase
MSLGRDFMNLQFAITNRRSVKAYNEVPVSKELVLELLNLSVYAPTHKFRQSWRFVWIDGEAKDHLVSQLPNIFVGVDEKEANIEYRKKVINGTKAMLVIINQKDVEDDITTLEEYGAASALIQNFQLLAFEKGLGTFIKTRLITGKLVDYLGVKNNEMVAAAITLGYYETLPKKVERIKAEEKFSVYSG